MTKTDYDDLETYLNANWSVCAWGYLDDDYNVSAGEYYITVIPTAAGRDPRSVSNVQISTTDYGIVYSTVSVSTSTGGSPGVPPVRIRLPEVIGVADQFAAVFDRQNVGRIRFQDAFSRVLNDSDGYFEVNVIAPYEIYATV